MKWGCVSPHNLLAVSYQDSRNLALNRPHAYIWATNWSTLSLFVVLTPWSLYLTWHLSSWRAMVVTCASGVSLHGARKWPLISSFYLLVVKYHMLRWVIIVLIIWFLYHT